MQGINHDRVSAWLADHIDGAQPPFEFTLITGGRSNLTFAVVDGNGRKYVLRRPPTGHVLATAHDMEREHRIISGSRQVGRSGSDDARAVHRRDRERRPVLRDGLRRGGA
ncbi:MAG: phosphotransferase [Ilumatobacteraceae bacterium]